MRNHSSVTDVPPVPLSRGEKAGVDMTETVDRLFRRIKGEEKQGGRVIDHCLIENTLKEIGEESRPGLISWIKEDRDRWARMLDLEDRINKTAIARDEAALKEALSEYRAFSVEMIPKYEGKGHTLNLFTGEKGLSRGKN